MQTKVSPNSQISPQCVREIESAQRLAQSRLRWSYAVGGFTLGAILNGWLVAAVVLLVITMALATMAVSQFKPLQVIDSNSADPVDSADSVDGDAEECYSLGFPDPCEYGWHRYTVFPSKHRYEQDICFGGPPSIRGTYEYVVDEKQVFARLLKLRQEGLNATDYHVIEGQVLEADIRRRETCTDLDQIIANFRTELLWNEVHGPLRYFILSKHGCSREFFSVEYQRLEKGFKSLEQQAKLLGAVRGSRHYYEPGPEADEATCLAIKELQSDARLKRLHISLGELSNYEHLVEQLERLGEKT